MTQVKSAIQSAKQKSAKERAALEDFEEQAAKIIESLEQGDAQSTSQATSEMRDVLNHAHERLAYLDSALYYSTTSRHRLAPARPMPMATSS